MLADYDDYLDAYPDIFIREIIYKNKNLKRISDKENLKNKIEDFIEEIWRRIRDKYFRFIKSSFIYVSIEKT